MEELYIDTYVVAAEDDMVRLSLFDHLGNHCSCDVPVGGYMRTRLVPNSPKPTGLERGYLSEQAQAKEA